MQIYGVEFEDDEWQIATINGQPEIMVNRKGLERLCELAPNQDAAAQMRQWLADNPTL